MNWLKNLFGKKDVSEPRKALEKPPASRTAAKSGPLRQRFASLAKPAIHLRPAETSAFSQLGGEPLLPETFVWPEWKGKPQSFLAQLDLAEIHAALPSFLPTSGLLYFFYDQEQSVWGFDPEDRGSWQVFYFNGDRATLKLCPAPAGMEEHAKFKPKPVRFHAIKTLPQYPGEIEDDEESDAYDELRSEAFEGLTPHYLLGHPRPVQGDDMELECQLAFNGINVGGPDGYKDPRRAGLEAGAKDWRLLLQLDTDDDTGWMWGDAGTIYFWIREQDAARADFSKVWLVFQCS